MKNPSIFAVLIILISFYTSNSKEPKMITIPLKVIESPFRKYPVVTDSEVVLEKKVEVQTPFGKKIRILKEPIQGDIKVLPSTLFAAPITIGFEQNFNVVLDTGSVNLWVAKVGSKDQYEIEHHYDPSKSESEQQTTDTFEIQYGTGSTKGNFYKDFVQFISENSYSIKFGAASETLFDVKGADGIMGLAKKYSDNFYSPLWTLYSKGIISSKSFSFKYFSKTRGVEMYLGDEHSDFQNVENTAQCQLLSNTAYDNLLWTCKLYNFGLTSQDHLTNITAECGYNFLFDTGSNTMILPMETFNLLYKNLDVFDCEKAENEYGVQIVCPDNDNLPDIFIEVGNHYLILDHKEMFNRYSISGKQILNVVFKKDITISIIGQPFFKLFHTKFDFENGLLKFYNEDKKYFIYSTEKPNNDKARDFEPIMSDISNWFSEHLLKIVLVAGSLLAVILIIVIICKCCKKNHSKKQSTLIEKKGKGKASK